MRYLFTILWAVLISFLISYVLSSMAGESLTIGSTFILAAAFSIIIFILGDGILKEESK